MIFADRTKSLIVQSIEVAREAVAEERISSAFIYEDFLVGEQLAHSEALTGAKGVKYDELAKLTFPFCDRVISELSLLYKQPPRRYLDSEKPTRANGGIWEQSAHDQELSRWHSLAEEDEADFNPTMVMLDKRTRHHGRCIVRVWAGHDKGSLADKKGQNYPRFDVFHPGQFDVIVSPSRPSRPLAVILYLETADADGGSNVAQVWTPEEVVEVVNGDRGPSLPNLLRELPFVGFANYLDQQSYWRAGLARKLCRNNAVFDLGMTHLFGMAIEQAHGQPVAKNPVSKWAKNPIYGWDKLVELEEDGEFSFAQAGADMTGMIAVLEMIYERTRTVCGLPMRRPEDNSQPESGVAYRVKNASVLEDRQERAALFGPRERQLWRMAFRVGRAFGFTALADPRSIVIDYVEPEIPVPQAEALAQRDSDLKAGIISMVDEYRRANPDIMGDVEALEELRRNAAINAEFLGVKAALTLRDLVAASKGARKDQGALGGDQDGGGVTA